MRIIPVIDLKNGLAVHAIRGERALYQPVNSPYSHDGNPLDLAQAFRKRLGCSEIYIADLDAIQKQGQNREIIAKIADQTCLRILLDAGITKLAGAREMLACGAAKVIIGSETLQQWAALGEIREAIPPERLVFSLDMRAGQVLSACPDLAEIQPLALLQQLADAGWSEVILLDLARVGTQTGLGWPLIAEARRRFPEIQLIAGGGVRSAGDLMELNRCGASGVLLATALHQEAVTAGELQLYTTSRAE
jgi:phosphoribosylformimino-5-aminoimidazole carboxamide ribotide isomerase